MSATRRSTKVVTIFLTIVAVFCLGAWLGRSTAFFTQILPPTRQAPFLSFSKLVPQLLGAYYAARASQHYGLRSAARRSWMAMSAWLGCWFVGQLGLAFYAVVLHVTPPNPCIGDLFFFLGYGFVIAGLLMVMATYRATGFAVGGGREHAKIAIAACVVFLIIAYITLVPIAVAPLPIGERIVNVGYPLLDMVSFVPTIVLLRITLRFRGGRVSFVWRALLAGILFAMGGDVIFAITSPENALSLGPISHLLFSVGYTLCAFGMRLQYELVSED